MAVWQLPFSTANPSVSLEAENSSIDGGSRIIL